MSYNQFLKIPEYEPQPPRKKIKYATLGIPFALLLAYSTLD